ncbi:MAG: N5-glutamine methyltransferase family protein [Burkholderiales bacterium]
MSDSPSVAEAYARGRVEFMGIELAVAPGALVPRAETELLGRTAVDILLAMRLSAPRVIDMCCGTGNLACAIAHHVPHSRVWASDLTDGCVTVARRNVELRRVSGRVLVHQGDLFASLAGQELEGSIDVIVCNPPYISEARLQSERAPLLELEPREAFAAGPYGISIHQRVIRDALAFLRPDGVLLFEVGLGQERQVKTLFERSRRYEDIRVVQNEAGEGRVVLGHSSAHSPA